MPERRTNVHLDEELLARCIRCTGHRTKKAVIEEALRALLRLHGQREVRDLRGRLRWEDPAEPGSGGADPR